jgi:hypothetical protein
MSETLGQNSGSPTDHERGLLIPDQVLIVIATECDALPPL